MSPNWFVCRGSFAGVVIELVSLSTMLCSSTYYYFLYLIFFTLHPWVASGSIRPLMGTPEGYNY